MADDAKIEMQDGGRRACVYRARAADLVRLRDLPDLRYVFLIGGNPTPARVRVIAALPNLDAVSMDNGRLPPAAFPLLNALPPGTAIDVAIGKRHRVAWNVYYRRRLARLLRLPPDHRAAAAERFARGVTALGFKLADPTGRSVEIASCDASDDDLRLLRWAPRLETLHFHHGWGVSTAGLCHLAGHPTLRVLELNGVRFTGSLRVAARLPALEELSFFPDYDTPATDAHTAGLERATGLRRLEAHDGTFTEATLARVGRLAGLRRLKLPWIADAGDDGLRPLAGLHALEWLSIRNLPGVSAEWLRHVAGLTELRSLSLPIERGDGNGLRHLAGLPNLRFLSLRWGKG